MAHCDVVDVSGNSDAGGYWNNDVGVEDVVMGWSGGSSILEVAVKEFKKLFPDLLENKKALKALVRFKEVLEDQDFDGFCYEYEGDPEIWDAALRAAGKKTEAREMRQWLEELGEE